jgi:hypothetical protein
MTHLLYPNLSIHRDCSATCQMSVTAKISQSSTQIKVKGQDLPQIAFRQCLGQPGLLQYQSWTRGPPYLHQPLLPQCHRRSPLHQPSKHLPKPSRMLSSPRRLRTPELPAGDRLQEFRRTVPREPTSPILIQSFWYLLPKGENLYRS